MVPVVQQDVGPPDLAVREPDVGDSRVVCGVPAQVVVRPVLEITHTHTQGVSFRFTLYRPPTHSLINWLCIKAQKIMNTNIKLVLQRLLIGIKYPICFKETTK